MSVNTSTFTATPNAGEFRNVNVRLTGGLLINWINSALRFLPTLSQQEITNHSVGMLLPALAVAPTPG